MATVTITPDSNIYGETTTVVGTGFAITTAITVTWDGSALITVPSSITSSGIGAVSFTFEIPQDILGVFTIIVSDGTTSVSTDFEVIREPEYTTVEAVSDWLRIPITANTDPNRSMIKEYIMDNEDRIDRLTGHSWLGNKQCREVFDVGKIYDWGRGMPLFLRHRNIRDMDTDAGDKVEVWDGANWVVQSIADGNQGIAYFETTKGITYLRGYLFSILQSTRFRITYRYGGSLEYHSSKTAIVPRDINKACKLMTAIDILSTDFKFSKIAYGGDGQIDKADIINKWQDQIDEIIHSHSEIITIW